MHTDTKVMLLTHREDHRGSHTTLEVEPSLRVLGTKNEEERLGSSPNDLNMMSRVE